LDADGRSSAGRHRRGTHADADVPAHLTAPLRAGPASGLAFAGFATGLVLAAIFSGVALAVTHSLDAPLTVAAGFVGLWIPLVGAAILATRRGGTGSLRDDLGLQFRPGDAFVAVVIAIAGIVAATLVQMALSPFPRLLGSNTGFIDRERRTVAGVIVIVLTTMIGAPFVEELFFRGLIQRSLARLGVAAAVVQALLFGLIHFDPATGVGNVSVVLGVAAFGTVQGLAARWIGRIGPTILSHAMFNAFAVLPLLLKR